MRASARHSRCWVFSLPGPYGIGTLGNEAFAFVDFLAAAKQTYWQILYRPYGLRGQPLPELFCLCRQPLLYRFPSVGSGRPPHRG